MTRWLGLYLGLVVVAACGGGGSRVVDYDAPRPDSRGGGRDDGGSPDGGTLDDAAPDAPAPLIDAGTPDAAPDASPDAPRPPDAPPPSVDGPPVIAPAPPVLASTTSPASPSSSMTATVSGTVTPGTTVRLYGTAGCGGPALATTTPDAGGAWSLTIGMNLNTTNTIYATASDAAGHTSTCAGPLLYVHDNVPPAAPALTGVSPSPPTSDTTPTVSGTAEAGATVRLYLGTCTGTPVGSGAAPGGTFSIGATVPADVANTIVATASDAAGNLSPCASPGLVYVADATPPATPLLTGTSPTSPSSSPSPSLLGTAEPGASVNAYALPSCGGSVVGTDTASGGGTFSIAVSSPGEGARTFSVLAVDAAGNPSPCSASLAYVRDTVPPSPPTLASTPASPANANSPTVTGTAEAGATVDLYGAACTGAPLATTTAIGGTFAFPVAVADDSSTPYRAIATDSAGNPSTCSSTYTFVEDSTAPAPPVVSAVSPTGPVDGNTPTVTGTAAAGTTVRVYAGAPCAGAPLGQAAVGVAGTFSIVVTVGDDTQTELHATARDAAGNTSACSSTWATYVEQSASTVPSVAGTITWPGATGRIFVTLEETCAGCGSVIGGTSIAGPGPFLIRGVEHTGPTRVVAWLDALGTHGHNVVADPSAQATITLPSANVSDVDLTLVAPSPGTPPAPANVAGFGGADTVTVSWDDVEDAQGDELADHYEVYVAATPSPGPGNYTHVLDVPAAAAGFAIVYPVDPGVAYAAVRARAGTSTGPLVDTGPILVGAAPVGHTISGSVTWAGLADPGALYVFAVRDGAPPTGIRVADPTDPAAYTIPGLADGVYRLGVILDVGDDGIIDPTDPVTFEDFAAPVVVTVAGADVTAPEITFGGDPIVARVTTDHRFRAGEGDTYGIAWRVVGVTTLPVAVALRTGPNLLGPVDVALESDDRARFDLSRYLAGLAPLVGDAYTFDVTLEDGSVTTLTAQVTNVITELPTPLAPIGSSAGDADPLAPSFTWAAPASVPAIFSYMVSLYRAGVTGVWRTQELPSTTTSVAYDFDGGASEDPLLAGTTYEWEIIVVDDAGNAGRVHETFATP